MTLEFAELKYTEELWEEALALIEAHRSEVIDPDFYSGIPQSGYRALWESGMLIIFAAIDKETLQLVGYNVFLYVPKLDISEPMAQHNAIYLKPEARKWMNASRFIKFCDEKLSEKGISWVTQHVTNSIDFSSLLKRNGYQQKEIIFAKRLRPRC
jgi:hypothetical protein